MASAMGFRVSHFSAINSCHGTRSRAQAQNLDGESSTVPSSDSVLVSGASLAGKRETENGRFRSRVEQRISNDAVLEDLAPLWDDGYGTQTVEDYFNAVKGLKTSMVGHPDGFALLNVGQMVPKWGSFCTIKLLGIIHISKTSDPMKMASVNIEYTLPPKKKIEQLFHNLIAMLPCLTELANIIPNDTLLWRLRRLKSAAAYANSRLHAVKTEVLTLARLRLSLDMVSLHTNVSFF